MAIMYLSLKPYLAPGNMDTHCFSPVSTHSLSSDFPWGSSTRDRKQELGCGPVRPPGLSPPRICILI